MSIEIGRILKSKRVGYFRYIPVSVQQQGFCFFNNPVRNMFSGGFAGYFFYRPV